MSHESQTEERALLCLDQKLSRFQRLKDAVQNYDYGVGVTCVSSVSAAFERLAKTRYSIVVVAPEFEEEELKQLINAIPNLPGSQDTAVVMIISTQNSYEMEELMSIGLLLGANGFLKDPFSTQGVQETFKLTEVLKRERLEKRQRASLATSLREARRLIDNAALLGGAGDGRILKLAEEVRTAIRGCEGENPDLYYRLVVGSFIRLTMMEGPLTSGSYAGSSKRVKSQIAQKLAATGVMRSESNGGGSDVK